MAAGLLWTLDLDDTLIDTERSIRPRVRESIRRARAVTASAWDDAATAAIVEAIAAVGTSTASRLPRILAALDIEDGSPAAEAARAGYYADLHRHLALMPGALRAIASLRERGSVLIVTNGPERLQTEKIAATDLARHVDGVIVSETVGSTKPERDIFLAACERAGIAPDRATHIGDSLATDVAGARGAGFRAVWFRRPWGRDAAPDPTPDAIIDALDEVDGL